MDLDRSYRNTNELLIKKYVMYKRNFFWRKMEKSRDTNTMIIEKIRSV